MAFNINELTSSIQRNGAARADFFDIFFTGLPAGLEGARDLTFRAEQVTIPQRAVSPIEYRDYGVPYKVGGLPNYIEIDMTFILSDDLREREFFMAWQDLIVGDHRTRSNASVGEIFDTGYFNDYKCDGIQINHYNGKGDIFSTNIGPANINITATNPLHNIKLIDAYPLNVATLSRSWAQPEFLRQQVTFTYRYFTEIKPTTGSLQASVNIPLPGIPRLPI